MPELATPLSPYALATFPHQSFHSEPLIPPTGQDLQRQRHQNPGMFNQAHNLSATGNFIDGNVGSVTYIGTTSNHFMEKLLEKTILGAASDSSARYPPPRCHPGTRLAVLERCLYFIANCHGEQKIRWVVGAAGVGKSAIMQSVADSPNLPVTCHVSVFFSINGRDDGNKAIITLSYQFAAKSALYRQLIESEIARDPSLLQSSMPVQFRKFIVEPFIHHPQLNSTGRVLVIIDGLDECNNPRTQQELLRLISDFCIKYPSSPLVWLIASRPEQHITSIFSGANVMPAYEKEEVPVDSDEARADVERFLRAELNGIKVASYSLDPHSDWPKEKDLWKVANASGGLFAYGHTVIRYIGDSNIGNPVSQLSDVLHVIDNLRMTGMSRKDHPMALLDALYARILSNVPDKVIRHTRRLILSLASHRDRALDVEGNFIVLCNWLAMTPDEAYAAFNQLHSVFRTPRRDTAHQEKLQPFHKSFIDYVSDSSRSDFFRDMDHEAQQLRAQCAFRILSEAPDGIDFGDVDYQFRYGTMRRGPGTGDKISLTWLTDEGAGWNDKEMKLIVYKMALGVVAEKFLAGDPTFRSEFCIRQLTTRFEQFVNFPFILLREPAFARSRRREFMKHGILKTMPLEAVDITTISRYVTLRFRHPPRTMTLRAVGIFTVLNPLKWSLHRLAKKNLSDPWNSSCNHVRAGEWEGRKDQDWKTGFGRDEPLRCVFCYERFERQLGNWKTHSPDHSVAVLFTSTGECCVEFRFVDPDDGMSEWTYCFWITLRLEERKKYGSTV